MKKLNRKGVTLVELIVSFAIVGVAIIYFFQTLTTVNKLYYTARKETNEFIEKSYVLRIADEIINKYGTEAMGEELPNSDGYIITSMTDLQNGLYKIEITNNKEPFYLYKYIKQP